MVSKNNSGLLQPNIRLDDSVEGKELITSTNPEYYKSLQSKSQKRTHDIFEQK